VSRATMRPARSTSATERGAKRREGCRRTEGDVELERQADDRAVGVEKADGLARGVDLRVRHEERAVHLHGALLPEDAAELVVHELGVRVVVDLGLRARGRSSSARSTTTTATMRRARERGRTPWPS